MHTITKQYRTETGHRLVDYDGKCSHFHGHSYLWEVTVTADKLTDNGMIIDFKDLKSVMEQVLEPLDHCMILSDDDLDGKDIMGISTTNGEKPRVILLTVNPTAENMAMIFGDQIATCLIDKCQLMRVKLWETTTSFAIYNPPYIIAEALIDYIVYHYRGLPNEQI